MTKHVFRVRYEADNILVIPDLTPGDAGDYVCKALYYPYGDAQANFYLNGISKLFFSINFQNFFIELEY